MKFKLKVYHFTNKKQFLTLAGVNESEARQQALEMGYQVISVSRQFGGFSVSVRPAFSIGVFSEELLALLEAGLSLVETVDALVQKSKTQESQQILSSLLALLREGKTFS